jgi:hypothetical protein
MDAEQKREPELGETRVMVCPVCGQMAECAYGPDPFALEIHGDHTPGWACSACRHESMMDT